MRRRGRGSRDSSWGVPYDVVFKYKLCVHSEVIILIAAAAAVAALITSSHWVTLPGRHREVTREQNRSYQAGV